MGTYSYATGPRAGQVITNLATLNGNGMVVATSLNRIESRSLNNFINDLRATRAFEVGKGELTVTGGVYKSLQDYTSDWLYSNHIQDVAADGGSALINYTTLIMIGLYLAYEAAFSFFDPQPVDGWLIVIIAGVALVIAIVLGLTLGPNKARKVSRRYDDEGAGDDERVFREGAYVRCGLLALILAVFGLGVRLRRVAGAPTTRRLASRSIELTSHAS